MSMQKAAGLELMLYLEMKDRKHPLHQASGNMVVVYYGGLPAPTISGGMEDMKVREVWQASRKGSVQGLEMCRKEAIDNMSVFFIMNNLGRYVC